MFQVNRMAYLTVMLLGPFVWIISAFTLFDGQSSTGGSFAYTPLVTTILLGLLAALSHLKKPHKHKLLIAMWGLSILVPLSLHMIYTWLYSSNHSFATPIIFMLIGGIVPFLTFGLAFPALAPFVAYFLFCRVIPFNETSKRSQWLLFLTFVICWEVTLLTGTLMGLGG